MGPLGFLAILYMSTFNYKKAIDVDIWDYRF